jgi:hypothetical protein
MKTMLTMALCLGIAACATQPMNRVVLHQHAVRNCRVKAAVAPAYKIDSLGVQTSNSEFAICMRESGFPAG